MFSRLLLLACLPFVFLSCHHNSESAPPSEEPKQKSIPVIVIHGGAGSIKPGMLNPKEEANRDSALHEALQIGYTVLLEGGTALHAVEQTLIYMENCPYFNAGKGSVFNVNGEVENDASIMDGTTLKAGAVAGIQNVKNPITLARLVKDSTQHVMLSGNGASLFANEMSVERVSQEYFFTEKRIKQRTDFLNSKKMGTVGCVALDRNANIAAGTSTGGMMYKKWGRIGDSPIIGAGTYANSQVAGVSCTGHGEYFIKNAVAYDVIARMTYAPVSLKAACDEIILDKLVQQNAGGGLIALDKFGNVAMPFNTNGMYRGYQNADTIVVLMYK